MALSVGDGGCRIGSGLAASKALPATASPLALFTVMTVGIRAWADFLAGLMATSPRISGCSQGRYCQDTGL